MDTQSIDDQLELLRLKELFMSDIDIRSKMAMLICKEGENSQYCEFCQLTHCTPDIARIFAKQLVIDVFLTPEDGLLPPKSLAFGGERPIFHFCQNTF